LAQAALELQGLSKRYGDTTALDLVGTLLLYIAIISFGYVVTSGVVEEKTSRVIEVVLSAIRPVHLLAGKVIGIGLPVAPLVVPGRVAQGELPAWELVASLALMVVGTLLMMMLAVRIYERTVLRMGTPVKLREVLRIRHSG
jgi:ABC-2 type transport system permease protein